MLRLATLAALAAVLAASPAAADSIRISTGGKTPEQVNMEIRKAAIHLCNAEVRDSMASYYLAAPCIKATIEAAVAQSSDPAALQVASR